MRYIRVLAVFSVVCFSADLVYSQVLFGDDRISHRIQDANQQFADLLKATPSAEISAVMFFKRGVWLQEAVTTLRGAPLEIRAFRHGDSKASGGYILHPGESLDEAVLNYKERHITALKVQLERARDLLASPPDESMVPALLQGLYDAEDALRRAEATGVRVIGIEIRGKIGAVSEFAKLNELIQFVELNTGRNSNPIPTGDNFIPEEN